MIELEDEIKNHPKWSAFDWQYCLNLRDLLLNPPKGFDVLKSAKYIDVGHQAVNFIDYECAFAARMLQRLRPNEILDVGSYRHFILGVLSHYNLTSVDVRSMAGQIEIENETRVVCDAKKLELESESFDVVMSLCSIEHFGLGRYGDEFDLDGDKKAFSEMRRVLKKDGCIIFSTTISRGKPVVFYNAHRVYSHEMILEFCSGLELIEESFLNLKRMKICKKEEITDISGDHNIYLGCWMKA